MHKYSIQCAIDNKKYMMWYIYILSRIHDTRKKYSLIDIHIYIYIYIYIYILIQFAGPTAHWRVRSPVSLVLGFGSRDVYIPPPFPGSPGAWKYSGQRCS